MADTKTADEQKAADAGVSETPAAGPAERADDGATGEPTADQEKAGAAGGGDGGGDEMPRKNEPTPPNPTAHATGESEQAARVSRALAEAREEAERKQLDETVPGGRYIDAMGNLVNAAGEPISQ